MDRGEAKDKYRQAKELFKKGAFEEALAILRTN